MPTHKNKSDHHNPRNILFVRSLSIISETITSIFFIKIITRQSVTTLLNFNFIRCLYNLKEANKGHRLHKYPMKREGKIYNFNLKLTTHHSLALSNLMINLPPLLKILYSTPSLQPWRLTLTSFIPLKLNFDCIV